MSSVTDVESVLREDEPIQIHDEFTLDPSDPLNLLLNSSTDTDSSSSQAPSPPDWSQFSSLWPMQSGEPCGGTTQPGASENAKLADFGMDFDFSLPMDLDFTNGAMSMAIDPSALHFDSKAIHQPLFDLSVQPQDLLSASFPFTFSSPTLSTTSASSASTEESLHRPSMPSETSVSPLMEPSATPAPPVNAGPFMSSDIAPKLPIPRLAPSGVKRPLKSEPVPPTYQSSSASSSPSPGPGTPSSETGSAAQGGSGTSVISRPKTSHTTIERRYRTNLNARIQSLKQTVPALRVLDQNHNASDGYVVDERGYIDGVKVARKGSKANVLGKAVEYIRVLKRREARLKREQDGLRTLICGIPGGHILLGQWEQQWVQKFGGPERDEIDNEAEAYEGSDDEDGDGEDEGDDSERARKKPKVTKAPPAKKEKRKIAPAAAPPPVSAAETADNVAGIVVPEKRKRGRPRKIQPNAPLPSAPSAPVLLSDPAAQAQQVPLQTQMAPQTAQPQQYLLAVFALFSFFNSPWTSFSSPSASHTHTHKGSVLSHVHTETPTPPAAAFPTTSGDWSWNDVVQTIHLLASLLVLASVVVPWLPLPRRLRRTHVLRLIPFTSAIYGTRTSAPSVHSTTDDLPTPPASPIVSDSESDTGSSTEEPSTRPTHEVSRTRSPLTNALAKRGSEDEREAILTALRLSGGFSGIVQSVLSGGKKCFNASERALERQAWARLAELVVMDPTHSTSITTRLQIYIHLSSILDSSPSTSTYTSNLCTSAFLVRSLPLPLAQARSTTLWNLARAQKSVDLLRPYERLVLETLDIEEAAERLGSSVDVSPVAALAASLVNERLRTHASLLFTHGVAQGVPQDESSSLHDKDADEAEVTRRRETISAGRSLGGRPCALVDAFEKVWESGVLNVDDLLVHDATDNGEEEIETLLTAIVLYRRVFPSQILSCNTQPGDHEGTTVAFILSPPPSPPSKYSNSVRDCQDKDVLLRLRRALGSSVFDYKEREQGDGDDERQEFSLEDARDRVVDMLVDVERRGRNRLT
ncbi:hypothetical protein BV22DRAFT_1198760 [Leucogyrophana mollusca]|uniref:Uncharacterized protein n=1 Tax=Leucogyrophana mollusca TaxID=85980 RepID=A0ACB8B566_9AGAM|nr:hypothetical protein BV22DRAFT_1198760 [Leucogyrophana mollusca]